MAHDALHTLLPYTGWSSWNCALSRQPGRSGGGSDYRPAFI